MKSIKLSNWMRTERRRRGSERMGKEGRCVCDESWFLCERGRATIAAIRRRWRRGHSHSRKGWHLNCVCVWERENGTNPPSRHYTHDTDDDADCGGEGGDGEAPHFFSFLHPVNITNVSGRKILNTHISSHSLSLFWWQYHKKRIVGERRSFL